MTEEWRPTHLTASYEVSSLGRVRSLDRLVWGGPVGFYLRPGKILSPAIGSHGYPGVTIHPFGTQCVHILVTRAFIGPCPAGEEVRHKDGEKWHCALSNLKYGTGKENSLDAFQHGSFNPAMLAAKAAKGIDTKDVRYPGWRSRVFTSEQFCGYDL